MKEVFKDGKKLIESRIGGTSKIAEGIFDAVKPMLGQYIKWGCLSYEERKDFVRKAIEALLKKFPNNKTADMQVLFREDVVKKLKADKSIPSGVSAFCYVSGHSAYNDAIVRGLLKEPPQAMFAFLHDLETFGMLEQIAHEFTHYLQYTGQSSLSPDVVKHNWNNYVHPFEDKDKYRGQPVEKEAREIGDAVGAMFRDWRNAMVLLQQNKQKE